MCVTIEEKFLAFEIVPFGSLEVFFFSLFPGQHLYIDFNQWCFQEI